MINICLLTILAIFLTPIFIKNYITIFIIGTWQVLNSMRGLDAADMVRQLVQVKKRPSKKLSSKNQVGQK
jgi:hypothetical protein